MLMLDSSVWFDYFLGKPWTRRLKSRVDSSETILISAINLIEIYSIYLKRNALEAEEKKNFLMSRCRVVDVDVETALEASRLKAKHTLAIADSIILATARKNESVLMTTDPDFTGLQGVHIIQRR